jgi:hypothetical protein
MLNVALWREAVLRASGEICGTLKVEALLEIFFRETIRIFLLHLIHRRVGCSCHGPAERARCERASRK